MSKKIKINEQTEDRILADYLAESLSPCREQVLIVKDFLDDNFIKTEIDDIDANGYPKKIKCVSLVSGPKKQALKTMQMKELLLMLDDKFNKMIKDKKDRRSFLKQIIKDWYNNSIDHNGILSINHIQ